MDAGADADAAIISEGAHEMTMVEFVATHAPILLVGGIALLALLVLDALETAAHDDGVDLGPVMDRAEPR